jgi:hypothetical protein
LKSGPTAQPLSAAAMQTKKDFLKCERVMRLNISREDAKTRRDIEGITALVNIFFSDDTLAANEEIHGLKHVLEFSSSRLRAFA